MYSKRKVLINYIYKYCAQKYGSYQVRTAVDYIGKRIKLSPSDEKACMVVGVRINMEKELDLEVRMDDEDEVFCVAFKVYDIVV